MLGLLFYSKRRDRKHPAERREPLTFDSIRREESQIPSLQRILIRALGVATLRFRFASQRGVVHFEAVCRYDTDIGRNTITTFDLDQIASDHFFSVDGLLLAFSDDEGELNGNESSLILKKKRG